MDKIRIDQKALRTAERKETLWTIAFALATLLIGVAALYTILHIELHYIGRL